MSQNKGRVTIPTNLDVVKETLDIVEEWADAIRDCEWNRVPGRTQRHRCKDYATYVYNKEKDNAWAKANRMRSSRMTA